MKKIFSVNLFLISSILLFLFFGTIHLTKFITADEHYWTYERIPQYWNALKEEKFKKTLISDKPGITLALFSGSALLRSPDPLKHQLSSPDKYDLYNWAETEQMNFNFRLPILLLNSLLLVYIFWISKRLTNNSWISLWSTILISLSPIIIGISQILNPDAIFWSLGASALFSYFALLKTGGKKFIFITSIFLGLSLLTKYVASFFYPFLFFSLIIFSLSNKKSQHWDVHAFFKKQIPFLLFIILGSLLVATIFLPAILIKPIYLFRIIIGFQKNIPAVYLILLFTFLTLIAETYLFKNKFIIAASEFIQKHKAALIIPTLFIFFAFIVLLIGRNIFENWQLFEDIPFDSKNLNLTNSKGVALSWLDLYLLEFNPLVFSLTPIVLLPFLVQLVFCAVKKYSNQQIFLTTSVSFFVFAYYLATILSKTLATIRYSIIIYPLISLLAAYGIWNIKKLKPFCKIKNIEIYLTILIIVCSVFSIVNIKPFYFNYTNFLLPKSKVVTHAWGYGGYEAAQYINSLPDAEKLTVWSDYYGVCEFIKGKCITSYKFDTAEYKIDYYVLTLRGEQRYDPLNPVWKDNPKSTVQAYSYYKKDEPVWSLFIGEREKNYIKIFKAN